jgi:hypothetical protein
VDERHADSGWLSNCRLSASPRCATELSRTGSSRVTPEAVAYADRVAARVVLIDSQALSGLMVHHNIGMQDEHTYAIKWIDEDFFDES